MSQKQKKYYGSHDVPAILGYHPFQSPVNVYLKWLGLAPAIPPSEPLEWGLRIEPAILQKFREAHKVQVEEQPHFTDKECKLIASTPDGDILSWEELLEAKNIRFNRGEWGEPGTDQVPPYILLGAHTHLMTSGRDRIHVAVLFSGQSYQEFIVDRDPRIFPVIRETVERFHQEHIIKRKAPRLDHTEASKQLLNRLYPIEKTDTHRSITPTEAQLAQSYDEIGRKINRLKNDRETIKNNLCKGIGSFEEVRGDGAKITWKTVRGNPSYKDTLEELVAHYWGENFRENKKQKAAFDALVNKHRADDYRKFGCYISKKTKKEG